MKKILLYLFIYTLNIFANDKLQVSVSIPPLYFFVNEIAKENVNINIVVPPNKNAETYEPTFNGMQMMGQSDIFIGIGMPFEKIWLPKILDANKQQSKTIVLLLDEKMNKKNYMHLWLSINNAKEIANIIANELANKDKKHKSFYIENANKLINSLDKLEQKIKRYIESMPNKEYIVYHPILDEFSKEYGLIEHTLEQHGKKYGIQEILSLAELGKTLNIKRVFTEYENKDILTLAKSINAKVIIIDALNKDYLNNLEHIFMEISKSYIP